MNKASFIPDESVLKVTVKSSVLFGPTTDDVGLIVKYCFSFGNSFGAIGIKKYRYALLTGLCADFIGIVMAIIVARMFFL